MNNDAHYRKNWRRCPDSLKNRRGGCVSGQEEGRFWRRNYKNPLYPVMKESSRESFDKSNRATVWHRRTICHGSTRTPFANVTVHHTGSAGDVKIFVSGQEKVPGRRRQLPSLGRDSAATSPVFRIRTRLPIRKNGMRFSSTRRRTLDAETFR